MSINNRHTDTQHAESVREMKAIYEEAEADGGQLADALRNILGWLESLEQTIEAKRNSIRSSTTKSGYTGGFADALDWVLELAHIDGDQRG